MLGPATLQASKQLRQALEKNSIREVEDMPPPDKDGRCAGALKESAAYTIFVVTGARV
jgi:hypothetical protein